VLAERVGELWFERERALRVLALLSTNERATINRVMNHLWATQDSSNETPVEDARQIRTTLATLGQQSLIGGRWLETPFTPGDADGLRTSYLVRIELAEQRPLYNYLQVVADCFVTQVALKVQMSIAAYRIDHDELPSDLKALVPNYVGHLPIDPYSGEAFHYEANGLTAPVIAFHDRGMGSVEPGTPFLWSVGSGDCRLVKGSWGTHSAGPPDGESPQWETNYQFQTRGAGFSGLVFTLE
jgi:hypothetical protein